MGRSIKNVKSLSECINHCNNEAHCLSFWYQESLKICKLKHTLQTIRNLHQEGSKFKLNYAKGVRETKILLYFMPAHSNTAGTSGVVLYGHKLWLIFDHISQNHAPTCSLGLEKIYIVEYCEFFKMSFSKILDFRCRLKTYYEALKWYK